MKQRKLSRGVRSIAAFGLLGALAVVIACSRLYLTVHYPTDVLAGAVVGAACGLGGAALVSWFLRRKENPHAAV